MKQLGRKRRLSTCYDRLSPFAGICFKNSEKEVLQQTRMDSNKQGERQARIQRNRQGQTEAQRDDTHGTPTLSTRPTRPLLLIDIFQNLERFRKLHRKINHLRPNLRANLYLWLSTIFVNFEGTYRTIGAIRTSDGGSFPASLF